MSRLSRGWMLTKESWGVVRADRTLLVFPVVAGYAGLLIVAFFIGVALIVRSYTRNVPAVIAPLAVGVYLLAVASNYCNVALSACAARALDGHDTTVSEGFAVARQRRGAIFGWAGIQLVVGAVIALVQAVLSETLGNVISGFAGGLANLAWGAASFFVLPIIAIEGLDAGDALKRSTSIIRKRWGEGVVGTAAVGGLVLLLAVLPGWALIAGGVKVHATSAALGIAMIGAGVVIIVVGVVVQTALIATFRVALYRFATEDRVVGGFEREPLESAFAARRRRLRPI